MPSFQFRNPRIKGFYLRNIFRLLLLKRYVNVAVIAHVHAARVGKNAAHRGGRQDAGGVMLGHGGGVQLVHHRHRRAGGVLGGEPGFEGRLVRLGKTGIVYPNVFVGIAQRQRNAGFVLPGLTRFQ